MSKSLRTLKVVIPDGNPLNYKQVVGGSDCVMHVLSRSFCISEHLNELKGMQRPALYLLIDEKGKGYIGQTKGFAARVKDHLAKKPWWTRAYVFVSASGLYNTANVEYLEYIAIRAAQESASYDMSDNGQTPTNPTLHEWDRPEFDEVFEQIKFFLLCERCFIFEKVGEGAEKLEKGTATAATLHENAEPARPIFYAKRKGIVAKGYPLLDGTKSFVVLKGSLLNVEVTPSFSLKKQREKVLESCVLKSKDAYELCEDYVFTSPSSASGVCNGFSSNGFEDWKLEDGTTLKTYLAQINK
ncbi:MAG: GIY-YIG nuclease family protein [Prevotellaceae bacterium]|nr:GIY-YIG nuclease family protein [Prevotellaceae bacterium]